jgi:hypothetical protein
MQQSQLQPRNRWADHGHVLTTLDKRFIDLVVAARITDRPHALAIMRDNDGRVRGAWIRALDALDKDPSFARSYIARRSCGCIVAVMREDDPSMKPSDRDHNLAEWRLAGLAIELILSTDARIADCQHQIDQPNMFDEETTP